MVVEAHVVHGLTHLAEMVQQTLVVVAVVVLTITQQIRVEMVEVE
jgi:hypothetical protein